MLQCQYEIHISKNDTYSMDRPHFHGDIEIVFCISGEGVFFLEPEVFPLFRGQLFLIDSSILHRSVANEEYRCMVFHISSGMLHEFSSLQSNFLARSHRSGLAATLTEADTKYLEDLFWKLSEDVGSEFGGDIKQTITLLTFLLTCFSHFNNEEEAEVHTNPSLAKVAPVLAYIQENLAEAMTIQTIADTFFMSKYHLCHIFKEATGFSLMDYVINCRILKARSLLREGVRVQEVGEAIGFRNNEHFIRTFKKLTGTPPKKYALLYRESDQNMKKELVVIEGKDGTIIEGIKA